MRIGIDCDGVLRNFIPALIDSIKETHPEHADKIKTSRSWDWEDWLPFWTDAETEKYVFEDKTYIAGKVYKYRLKQVDFDGAFEYSAELTVETTVPERAELAQNYPNPFNPSTIIKFSMPEADFAKLTVYNSIGQEVKVLINENLEAGFYTYLFDGSKFASGTYIYKLETVGRVISKKMLLVK